MSDAVPLRLLSRREVESVVLLLQSYTSRLNATVEEFTKLEWRVRRELDRVRMEFGSRVQFVREVGDERRRSEKRVARNERFWRDLEGMA